MVAFAFEASQGRVPFMMKWLTITALSSIGGYAGWDIGARFISPNAGLWLSLIGGLVGTAAAYFLVPRE